MSNYECSKGRLLKISNPETPYKNLEISLPEYFNLKIKNI